MSRDCRIASNANFVRLLIYSFYTYMLGDFNYIGIYKILSYCFSLFMFYHLTLDHMFFGIHIDYFLS